MIKMYLEVINDYEVWYDGDTWVVEDVYGLTPYPSFQEAKEACLEN